MLRVGKHTFASRLFVGTGKYATPEVMVAALEASGTDCVTVAVRRVDLAAKESILTRIDRSKYRLLPNTAGCYTAEDALRYSRLGREAGLSEMIKLEVLADEKTLLPDVEETLKAARVLVKEGFSVFAYTNDDPVTALKLQDAGCASVMPLGSLIGSGLGILNPHNIQVILHRLTVPVIVDAGVGTASDVALAMELGAAGVLCNTGIAHAKDPARMAAAMKHGVIGGRLAFLAGRIPKKPFEGAPSSPASGMLTP
ncbi:MAG: thiazole synthase [Candidatus Brocadiae bacterium]|nr:thiazole synthase [Candidatus Brocadiia bacterium]